MNAEALFVAGYAAVLLLMAFVMDWAARASHETLHRTKTIGFTYHPHLNAWRCSEGTFLWHHETDEAARVVRFRGKAEICNACALKPVCTDSNTGRTLVRPLDSWPHSEMARFQRVLSFCLIVLAGVLSSVEIARQPVVSVKGAFAGSLLAVALLGVREWGRVRAVKTPWGGATRSARRT